MKKFYLEVRHKGSKSDPIILSVPAYILVTGHLTYDDIFSLINEKYIKNLSIPRDGIKYFEEDQKTYINFETKFSIPLNSTPRSELQILIEELEPKK
jgi:hypothetical protein